MDRDMYMSGKFRHLRKELERYEGQPIKVFTDDGRVHCGIDEEVTEDGVRLLDKCSRQIFIELAHIDAIIEPQMSLRRCCNDHCECEDEEDEGRYRDTRDRDRDTRDRDRDTRDRDRDTRDRDRDFDRDDDC